MTFFFYIPQMKEIWWYLSESATHPSTWCSVAPDIFLQIIEFSSLFLNKTPLHECAYFIYSFIHCWNPGCIHSLAITMNTEALNMGVQVSLWCVDLKSSRHTPRSYCIITWGFHFIFIFEEHPYRFPQCNWKLLRYENYFESSEWTLHAFRIWLFISCVYAHACPWVHLYMKCMCLWRPEDNLTCCFSQAVHLHLSLIQGLLKPRLADLNSWYNMRQLWTFDTSSSTFWILELPMCTTMSSLYDSGYRTQSFVHDG